MKTPIQLLLLAGLSISVLGCKNAPKTEALESIVSDSMPVLPSIEAVLVDDNIQTLQPFKGEWSLIHKAYYDEQAGFSHGRYEELLYIDFYDESYNNCFFVANDKHEGYCTITSFKINGNEADIRYESPNAALYSAKLIYNPKDKSMKIINGELLDKRENSDFTINEFEILIGGEDLKFKGSNGVTTTSQTLHLEGKLSKSKIKMQLDIQGEVVDGTYCYTKHNTPIRLMGAVIDGVYTINEFNDGNNTGTFTLTQEEDGTLAGYWSNGDKLLPVTIKEQ